jgi:predicted phage terminase large subunit-like protein
MEEGGTYWEVVKMQAIYDGLDADPIGRQVGEALWPEWESLDELRAKERDNGPMKWAALFQQNPTPAGGIMFKVNAIEKLDRLPDGPIKWARHWDIAGTAEIKGRQPDWTVGLKMGAVGKRWVIGDVKRDRLAPAGVEELILRTAKEDGYSVAIGIPQDPGAAGKFMASSMAHMLAGWNVKTERETGDKVDRATPVAAQVDAGNVAMLKAPWNDALLAELSAFPNGKHDDQADALSGAFKLLFNPAQPARFLQIRHGVR